MAAVTTSDRLDARVVRTRNDVLGAALAVLLDEGWQALTQPHLAEVSGYSRATVYKHWPTRTLLLQETFTHLADMPHHTPTGDLRADLIAELTTFRTAMAEHGLDRALAVLADLTASVPEMRAVRDELVRDGERVVRELLSTIAAGPELEAATLMLCGAVLHSALLHGRLPADDVIAATVDRTLRGFGLPPIRRRPPEHAPMPRSPAPGS